MFLVFTCFLLYSYVSGIQMVSHSKSEHVPFSSPHCINWMFFNSTFPYFDWHKALVSHTWIKLTILSIVSSASASPPPPSPSSSSQSLLRSATVCFWNLKSPGLIDVTIFGCYQTPLWWTQLLPKVTLFKPNKSQILRSSWMILQIW